MARDWKGKDLDLIREATRHGESMLAAQVDLATSADQRAAVLAGIFTAVATGIIGAAATHNDLADNRALAVGAGLTIVAYLLGSALCIITALPSYFWPPGNNPDEWYQDIDTSRPLPEAMGEQMEFFAKHIHQNNKALERNARLFFAGAVIGVAAPVIGLVSAGITCLLTA
jgi:hypothetical protein